MTVPKTPAALLPLAGPRRRGCLGAARRKPMGVTERVWGALTSMIKLEDRVARQSDALKSQQARIENLTERVIRLEAQLELLTSAALAKRLPRSRRRATLPHRPPMHRRP